MKIIILTNNHPGFSHVGCNEITLGSVVNGLVKLGHNVLYATITKRNIDELSKIKLKDKLCVVNKIIYFVYTEYFLATTVHFEIFMPIATGCCLQQDLLQGQPPHFRVSPMSSALNECAWKDRNLLMLVEY